MRLSSTVSVPVLCCTLAAAIFATRPATAIEFPFDAVVNVDDALVWSGTSGKTQDYSTMELRRGDRVRVLHQEFGGWYKITPPEGSFSWVREDKIDRTGQQGLVKEDTMGIIGSETGTPQFEVRNLLRSGEVVEILSQAETLERGPRSTPMLRIKPPRGEFRFIRQRDLVPADQFVASRDVGATGESSIAEVSISPFEKKESSLFENSDPVKPDLFGKTEKSTATPVIAADPMPGELPGGANFELTRTAPLDASAPGTLPGSADEGISMKKFGFEAPSLADPATSQLSNVEKKKVEAAWAQLKQLDREFQTMRKLPVTDWNFASLKRGYESLQKTPDSFVRRQIERRLAGLNRYETVYQEVAEVQSLFRRTEEKDEKLRQSYLAQRQSAATEPTRTTVRAPAVIPATPDSGGPIQRPTSPPAAGSRSPFGTPSVGQTVQKPRFDGAGIIQRARTPRGGAHHVLLDLDGRVLTYLQGSPGINLDFNIGQSMGLFGPRQHRRDLGADFMVVRRMMRVRLLP